MVTGFFAKGKTTKKTPEISYRIERSKSPQKHKFTSGAVAFIDILGWKGIWTKDKKAHITLDNAIYDIKFRIEDFIIKNKNEKIKEFQTISISDTIAILIEGEAQTSINLCADICQYTFCLLLSKNLFVRGAITYGEYQYQNNIMVGPAIDEVTAWHEDADWAGIIQSPSLTFFTEIKFQEDFWIEYDVPLKSISKKKLQCINWPKILKNQFNITKEDFLEKLKSNGKPLDQTIAKKYFNTYDFYIHCTTEKPSSEIPER